MALSSRAILLICIFGYVTAQYGEVDGPSHRTGTTAKPRYQRLQNSRSANGPQLQSIGGVNRPRRPVPLSRPRPLPTPDGPDFTSFSNVKPRPVYVSPLVVKTAQIPTAAQDRHQIKQDQQKQQQHQQQQQQQQQQQSVKPVNEESEEDEDVAQAIANLGAVSTFSPQSGNFVNGPLTPKPDFGLGQYRGASPSPPANPRPVSISDQNIAPVQYRPQKPLKLRKTVVDDVPEVRIAARQQQAQTSAPTPLRTTTKVSENSDKYAEPRDSYTVNRAKFTEPREKYGGTRGKKPVAQIIRRWREDNPDGSITWGFENDDGSYKEELIGVDCITRGKYGYIDLDGFRREYTYETGIKCDEEEQEEERENGFVDYQENKLVLPNGKTIDLSSMGKKQARRPQPIYAK